MHRIVRAEVPEDVHAGRVAVPLLGGFPADQGLHLAARQQHSTTQHNTPTEQQRSAPDPPHPVRP
eukprot:14375437-Alexandrium_andersonii.AAC.1